ncbi:MAG: hypothetical protein ACRCT8_15520 [Lacipirellulaceae bacterium]
MAIRRTTVVRALLASAALSLTVGATTPAAAISLIVDRDSGQTFLRNETSSGIIFDGYELYSASGAMSSATWSTIAGSRDDSGNGSVDQIANWFVISRTDAAVSEASLQSLTAVLFPGGTVSLGPLFRTGRAEDLSGAYSRGPLPVVSLIVDFRSLRADYDDDFDVDLADYNVWSTSYGSSINLAADGNGDGVVNAADYTVWRDSPELSLAALATAGSALAIPEPASAALLFCAAALRGRRAH